MSVITWMSTLAAQTRCHLLEFGHVSNRGDNPLTTGPLPLAPRICDVTMRDGKPCGRLLIANQTFNGRSYCLMHLPTPGKDLGDFQVEFERILRDAGDGAADFTEFVFPALLPRTREFAATCIFNRARFTRRADFGSAAFAKDVDFSEATFEEGADFTQATFNGIANFIRTRFDQMARFREATFRQPAHFDLAEFTQRVDLHGTAFREQAQFTASRFGQPTRFVLSVFEKQADFSAVTFPPDVEFVQARFAELADFTRAKFLGTAQFREVKFRQDGGRLPGPVFSLAQFSQPESTLFYKTYLGQALFHNCDVSKMTFSSVEWHRREGSRKQMVFEEDVDLAHHAALALRPKERSSDEREYGLVAELYQQLKKNYDDKRDYWTAGDFHYGEMEMKRLASPRRNRLLRWLHRHLGLVAWYRYASQYGESYLRPALLLLGVLVAFSLLYPVAGLRYDSGKDRPAVSNSEPPPSAVPFHQKPAESPQRGVNAQSKAPGSAGSANQTQRIALQRANDAVALTYSHPFRSSQQDNIPEWRAAVSLAWHSLWTCIFVAFFQKDLVYEPVYLLGRVIAVLEQALTSTLFALFLLAVRRRFRR